jgi:DNA-binding transcriptional ArsR family regulator
VAETSTGAHAPGARYICGMGEVLDMAAVAALVGDPARANILCALLDGRAFAAGELAFAAHVSPQTASGHLAKLAAAHLVTSSPQGRHRYYRLAGAHVAAMLESIMAVAAIAPPRCRAPRIKDDMRTARMCYDHLAGRLGVGLADAMRACLHVEFSDDGAALTASGEDFLREFGIDVAQVRQGRRIFCRPCIDWSERRPHLAGAVGAALAERLFALGWIARVREARTLVITPKGRRDLQRTFGVVLPEPGPAARALANAPA